MMPRGAGLRASRPTLPHAHHAHTCPLPRLLLHLIILVALPLIAEGVSHVATHPNTGTLRFLRDEYNVSIYENSLPRTYVAGEELMGVALEGLSPSAHITYDIVDGDQDGFFTAETEVVGGLAVLQLRTRTSLRDVLNRERRARYTLVVEARLRSAGHRGSTLKARTNVTVLVLDTNDNIPLFYPTVYEVSVGEDAALHTPLISVTAHDADAGHNGEVYYSLEDPKTNLFAVHPTTGVLSVTRLLSYLYGRVQRVTILAQDRGPQPRHLRSTAAARATVEVRVYQVNIHPPRITVQHLPHVVEHSHTHIYAIINVEDPDEGESGRVDKVTIVGGDPDRMFSITLGSHDREFNLAVLKLLDRELAPEGYNLTLQAFDCGTPSRSSRVNVHVNIADVNDHAPVFAREQYEEAVSEDAPPNTPVVRVAASDTDQGINGRVLFRVVAGNEDDKFSINPRTGLISTAKWLDHESTAYYSLTVAAVDQASNARRKQSSAKVIIRVLDANDNAPQFNTPNTEVTLDENEPIESYVTRMVASDVDSGENGFISYSIANLDQVPFKIDPFDGTVRTSSVLDYEAQRRVYTIKVRASDWGTPFKRETETTVKVKVRDVNDNRPQFVGTDCKGWVSVDAPVGTNVLTLSALDLDNASIVSYRLQNDMEEECWAMDASSGVLALTCDLRKAVIPGGRQKTYVLNITATDGTHVSDPTSVTIAIISERREDQTSNIRQHVECHETGISSKVAEVQAAAAENNAAMEHYALLPLRYGYNSHAPELPDRLPSVVKVREDAQIGTELLTLKATDHDRGYNGRVVYAVSNGDVDSVFKIGVESGVLEVVGQLDRERTQEYALNITVYDLGVPHRSVSRNLTVRIVDVNDNAPEFSRVSYSLHLPENTRNGTSVAQLSAQDADDGLNAQITYELVTDVEEFTVDRITGVVYMSGGLDRERRSEYDLRVRAWDSATESPQSALARVLVTVLDINDCPPEFGAASRLVVDVPEDLPLGAVVATLQATDQDLGVGGKLKYTLISGHGDAFRVDEQTGVVRLSSSLDFETRQSYNVTVRAQDGGSPSLEAYASLFIRIHDVDENLGPPVFPQRVVRTWVRENLAPGALVTTLTARDPDAGQLFYAITAGDGLGYFSVDREGVVRTLVVLDREASRGYWLTVVVSDGGAVPLTDTCHVYVEVEDVNDHIPQTEEPSYHAYVAENSPPDTSVITLKASDWDLAPSNLSFTITKGNQAAHFKINTQTGLLSTLWTLDREEQSEYELWVTVTDGQLSSVTPVFVTVTDVNDNAPEFLEELYRVTIPARSKSRKRAALFRPDPVDDGSESVWAWGDWVSFSPTQITAQDDALFRVFAKDADTGMNGDLDYSIKTGKGKKGRFKIHPKTGQVYTNKAFTPAKTFDLMVQAQDNGQPQLSATTRVLVRVADVPETSAHPPVLPTLAPAHVMETDPPGHLVAFVNAHDPDNDTLWYYITEGDESGRFSMGVDSGLVSLARRLDHEDQYHYTLTVAATDGVHTATTKLIVEVMDANDHRPVFSSPLYEGSVSEAVSPATTVLTLQCRDKDQSPSTDSAVYFSLHHAEALASHGLFTVDSTTGDLIVAKPLDREVSGIHELTVSCRDRGRRENADFARVQVTVTDDNDHDPAFLETMIVAKVSTGSAAGTTVARVLALDHDKGENGRLSYSIVEGNAGGIFSIHPSLGVVRLTRPLMESEPSEYLLLVRAMDHASQARAASVPVRVMVTSSPDAPPSWQGDDTPRVVEVGEWIATGSAVARLTASSPSSLHYTLTGGNDEGVFMVSPASGVVSLAAPLDYETTAWYNLTITATNLAGVSRSSWLGVTVLDENDWWPEWDRLHFQGSVLQTAAIQAPVFATHAQDPAPLTVTAHDRDQGYNGRVTYNIVEKDVSKYFSIDQHTGAVWVSGRLDDVAGTTVEFNVWAIDGGDPRRECVAPAPVAITIKKVNPPPLAFPKTHYSAVLYLPTFPGVRVFCLVEGEAVHHNEDTDWSQIQYSILDGDDTKRFEFDSVSRCLNVHDQLNLKSSYNLTLKATDGSITSTATVDIKVQDAPLSTLVFTKEKYWANVYENSTKEMNMVALGVKGQPLNHHVHYSILNPTDNFEIRPTSGVIKTTGKPFDREAKDHYSLVVQAKDVDEPGNVAHVLVHVAVMDINDNEPVFLNQPYYALVSTSAPRGHVVTKVRAVDADADDFGSVRYELVRGSGELFSVNKYTGEISLKQSLMVADKTYSLTVAAYDGGKQPLSSQAHVMIRVVSAEGPMFTSALYLASVAEDAQEGTPVARVEAASPTGEPIMYTIVAGNINEEFALDYSTGGNAVESQCVIQTIASLDYEAARVHNLTVRARDSVTGSHTDAHVTITVTDVNDNPPEFSSHVYKGSVSEAASPGQVIVQVSASDVDTGAGGEVRFSCGSGCELFEVRGEDGVVLLAGPLDTETQPQHVLTVVATDAGLPQLSSSSTVIVDVLDFNDNPPVWRQDSYSCRVSAEAQPGHVVSAVSAHDPDAGQVTPLHYAIHSGDRNGIFKVDSQTGLLTVTAPHKLENVTSLNLNMSVSDGVHVAFTSMHVAVVPSNYYVPRFSRTVYEGRVEENSAPGQLILTLHAHDPDAGGYGVLRYDILDQTAEGAFRIDKEGNVYTETPLDREATSIHTLRVSVTDEGGRADFAVMRVTVRDKNDNAPQFTLPEYQANINTDVAPGTTILKVEATDADEGVNSEVKYHMYEANSSEALTLFKVDPASGQVTLAVSAEGRDNEVYQFFIRGEDGGSPRHHSDVPVTIFLLPLDDRPPHCARKYSQFFLREDAPVGTVITTLWTEGPQRVQYSILADEATETRVGNTKGSQESSGPFAVTPNGLVVVRRGLDHERRRTHRITVTNHTMATPPALDYMTISVVVMDVNDCAPRFSEASYEAVVAENSEVGAVITILTATDDDDGNNGQVQYSFGENESVAVKSTFRIDPHSGAVSLAAPLDRETTPTYAFTVKATDGGPSPLSTTARVTVRVKDYNDNPPVFTRDTYVTAVPEDTATGTAVVELSVADADEKLAELDYFVTGGDSDGHFLVHASGQVYVAAALDRETQAEYTLIVTATDGKFTANTTVTVTVIDVNDNGPVCKEPLYRREVSEGVALGTHVASVVAWDADEGTAARSRYTLSGDGAQHFSIDQLSGHVTTATQLDRETRDHYSLVVVVEDWEHAEWQCEVMVEVHVTDTNDNAPTFTEAAHAATIPEDAPVNTVVLKIHATDPDLGISRRIRYNFVDSADGHFTIDATEGVVSLARPLDRETRESYTLTVRAVDQGVPQLSTTTQLTVTVSDVNDNPPEFVRKLHETTVAENTAVGTEVLRVMATSRDIGINAEISYSIQHTTREKYLHVHPKTGVISIGAPVDFERVQQVVATVVATDGGTPPLSATALVNLTVTDVNDNAPVFTMPSYTATVREDALQGYSVIQISASDVDSGVNSLVRYSIQAGNDDHCFDIDRDTGIVTVLKKLDREKVEKYQLTVSARDLGSPSNAAVAQVDLIIGDVNDNDPIFTQDNYTVVVQENRPVGYSMLRLMATDADAEPNGAPFTWEVINQGPDNHAFTLDQDGSLRLATNKLNHLVQNEYVVHVRVWDSGSPPLHANTHVTVAVVEESRYPPTVFPLSTTIISYRTAFPGGIIGRVTALDQDPYDTLQYSIAPLPREVSSIKYFDIDGQDGTLVALIPLDSGSYSVNVSVSDGRYHRTVQATVQVTVITEEMVENSVIVRIGPLSPDEFLSRYQRVFLRAVANELSIDEDSVTVVSLQAALLHSHSMEKIYGPQRQKRDIQRSLDVLIVVEKPDNSFLTREELLAQLKERQVDMKKSLGISLLAVMNSMCTTETDCSGHGACIDVVEISDDVAVPVNTQLASLVAPRFTQKAGCLCDQGYGGNMCEDLVNACGHRPCAEYEECTPTEATTRGYTCQCPSGRAGPSCQVDLTKCRSPSCHYPLRPLSFRGKSYAQYSIARQAESNSLVLSVFLRTRNPVGTLVYAAGDVDYSILEVVGGHVQYRWDCGSGEGLVRVSTIGVNNDQWHFINLTREGTISTLSVDGELSSGAAPGANDILNMDSDFIYIGATINIQSTSGMSSYSHSSLGFVGCLDQITIDGIELPVSITGSSSGGAVLKRLANVDLQCPELLPPAGVCGSYPCLNGGTCTEHGKSYNCTCPPRFTGAQCQVDTAPCSSSPCLNGGKCIVVGHTYECQCPSKLSGKRCEYGVFCNPNPCQNGGRCEEGADGPICKCQHFTGAVCQLDIDECTRNPCQNGGTCLNFYGGFKCICSSNVTGEYCTEAIKKPPPPSSALNITLEELVCILAVFLGCVVAMLLLVAWQRRRWRHKRHQQNNRIKLTDHHVKNDLKANDAPKRNSKICNVEADQGPPLPPRPASYTPSGTDSVILNTLKHLADLSAAGHESLELETLSRCSHEFLHSLNKPVVVPPNLSPPPPSNSDSDSLHKPWDHHNNLNDSYFMPIKDVGCDLVTNLGESRASPGQHSPFSDDSSVCGRRPSPPVVPPMPCPSLLSRRGKTHFGQPLEVITIHPDHPTAIPPPRATRPHSKVPGDKRGFKGLKEGYRYHWDDYDMRGSRTLVGCGGEGAVAATPDLLLLAEDAAAAQPSPTDDGTMEGLPLLAGTRCDPKVDADSGEETAATPLLSMDVRDTEELPDDDDDEDDEDDDPCSFEEILLANNISLGSIPDLDLDHNTKYNIVSDIEDDHPESPIKISNVPSAEEDVNRLGSPRSRRPFHRTDYSRVSDLSFLSALEEDDVDDSLSELQDSDHEPSEKPSDQQTATLIQTSLSEVFL
ncbi:fat-like cadherin-related tumor suppressor homolog isoform X3 [Panulirus ornatus]|uniref:fat-like cadherin-related tumor suppressor homolog isoform X3 n=1 Tax=Panulirus ornatus TaxID=150431 RepID=UPI003A8629E0